MSELNKRTCTNCGISMSQGYRCCDESYCSKECLDKSFVGSGTAWEEHHEEDSDCYWTQWEDEE